MFPPYNSMTKACSVPCALALVNTEKDKEIKKEEREFKKETVRRKKELRDNDKGFQMGAAQDSFNKFIRERDRERVCISCDRIVVEWTPGGQWDCGHYKSRGAYPELRFCEINAHKQCKSCNGGSGKYAKKSRTVSEEYTIRLVERIGQKQVDWLNGPHELKRYTTDDYKAIKEKYNRKYKELIDMDKA